jgi:hypothetical protein
MVKAKVAGLIQRILPFIIVMMVALLLVNPFHLFDKTLPAEGDARAHLNRLLSNGFWFPGFSFDWYAGYLRGFYPPLFYLLGHLLIIAGIDPFVAYKLLRLTSLLILFISVLHLSKVMSFNSVYYYFPLLMLLATPPLAVTMMSGAFPFLLSVGLVLLACSFLIREGMSIRSAVLFGLSALTHLYAVIIGAFLIITYMIIWRPRPLKVLRYISIIGFIASVYYVPVLYYFVKGLKASPLIERELPSTLIAFTCLIPILIFAFLMQRKRGISRNHLYLIINGLLISLFIPLATLRQLGFFLPWRFILPATIFVALTVSSLTLPRRRKLFVTFVVILLVNLSYVYSGYYASEHYVILPSAFQHLWNYYQEKPVGFDEFIAKLNNSVVYVRGGLGAVYSPVTFSATSNFICVTGAYNQGDPYFFEFHVYLEWQDKWLKYERSAKNLMYFNGANYVTLHRFFPIAISVSEMEKLEVRQPPVIFNFGGTHSGYELRNNEIILFAFSNDTQNSIASFIFDLPAPVNVTRYNAFAFDLIIHNAQNAYLNFDVLAQDGVWWRYQVTNTDTNEISFNVSRRVAIYIGQMTPDAPSKALIVQKIRIVIDDIRDAEPFNMKLTIANLSYGRSNFVKTGEQYTYQEFPQGKSITVELWQFLEPNSLAHHTVPIVIDTIKLPPQLVASHLNMFVDARFAYLSPRYANYASYVITDDPEKFEYWRSKNKFVILLKEGKEGMKVEKGDNFAVIEYSGEIFKILPRSDGNYIPYALDQLKPFTFAQQKKVEEFAKIFMELFKTSFDNLPVKWDKKKGIVVVGEVKEGKPLLLKLSYFPFYRTNGLIIPTLDGRTLIFPFSSGELIILASG